MYLYYIPANILNGFDDAKKNLDYLQSRFLFVFSKTVIL